MSAENKLRAGVSGPAASSARATGLGQLYADGLVRTPDLAASAERGPAAFEHYRNASSEALVERLRALGLSLLEQRAVGPGTSNQWLVHGRKVSEAFS